MHILNVMSSFKTVPVTLERFSPGKHCEAKTSLDMFLKMKILEEQRLFVIKHLTELSAEEKKRPRLHSFYTGKQFKIVCIH